MGAGPKSPKPLSTNDLGKYRIGPCILTPNRYNPAMETTLTVWHVTKIQKLYDAGMEAIDIADMLSLPMEAVQNEIDNYLDGMVKEYYDEV